MLDFPITSFFIAVTVIISYMAFSNETLSNKLIMNPYRVAKRKEYYRFISSGFIHNGYVHLIFNMITFFFFARWIESYFAYKHGLLVGGIYMVALYLAGIVVSDIPTYFQYKNLPHYNSLGASGGVAAVLFATILYEPLNPIYIYGVIKIPGFIIGAVYVIYSYFYSKGSEDNINHSAHLYGALFGFFFAVAVEPVALVDFFEKIAAWKFTF
ncbi:rhomboid family intramembrane serine protease [Thermoflexibacter ruber]|uniref:Membrane associated serine protease, rhomboid family n=1 Tax=Thermoflexibacter ruber TaxID=1003 RepID=A0A1I2JCG0_9BACT|nr:rhomboid family intramembrane serine protease [Thermoflexibacter ruber]SFF52214.1 Membrane associated serine protease, rhomboid family [Thermoflexibacter ruber]